MTAEQMYLIAVLDLMRTLGMMDEASHIQATEEAPLFELTIMCRSAKRELLEWRAKATRERLGIADNEGFTAEDAAQAQSHPAEPLLRRALATYADRRGTYGPSELHFADIAMAMFPGGLTLHSHTDWIRFGIFVQMLSKLARYTKDWNAPHIDSIHDMIPYAAMLEAEDRRHLGRAPFTMRPEDTP